MADTVVANRDLAVRILSVSNLLKLYWEPKSMAINRRRFIQGSVCVPAAGALLTAGRPVFRTANHSIQNGSRKLPLFIATWPFGRFACEEAVRVAQRGSMLDAIEKGIWVTENDVKNASVGLGGIPNANGQVELDACIMSGPDHNAGSVAGLQDILHPISIARLVMEKTPHVMLVGAGAKQFALEHGHSATELLTENQKAKWQAWKKSQAEERSKNESPKIDADHHDTIAMLGIDPQGNLFGGCSTSGWGYKIPGRVGDSPIIGSGLYVDNNVGAAGATGLGENVMRHCGSFLVVEMMRNGATPVEACVQAVNRIAELDPKSLGNLDINFIALNKAGEHAAAGTSKGFKYAMANVNGHEIIEAQSLTEKAIGPEGGNRK